MFIYTCTNTYSTFESDHEYDVYEWVGCFKSMQCVSLSVVDVPDQVHTHIGPQWWYNNLLNMSNDHYLYAWYAMVTFLYDMMPLIHNITIILPSHGSVYTVISS